MTSGKAKASHWTLNFPGWEVPHPVSSQQSGLGHKRLREHTSAACLVATQRSYGSGVHRPCPLLFALFFFFLSFFFLTLDAIALQRMGRPSSCVLDAWDKSPILTQDTLGPQVAMERLAAWKSPGCHRCLVAPETLNNQSLHIRGKLLNKREKPSEAFRTALVLPLLHVDELQQRCCFLTFLSERSAAGGLCKVFALVALWQFVVCPAGQTMLPLGAPALWLEAFHLLEGHL